MKQSVALIIALLLAICYPLLGFAQKEDENIYFETPLIEAAFSDVSECMESSLSRAMLTICVSLDMLNSKEVPENVKDGLSDAVIDNASYVGLNSSKDIVVVVLQTDLEAHVILCTPDFKYSSFITVSTQFIGAKDYLRTITDDYYKNYTEDLLDCVEMLDSLLQSA